MTRSRFSLLSVALVIAALVAVISATSGASTRKTASSVAAGSAISVRQTQLGRTLVDANGRTLYLFEADKPNISTLSAAGQAIWPPFKSSTKPRALSGVSAARVGTVAGSGQITYDGHPLYYYVGDRGAGQTTGQGLNQFGALWYVLGPSGAAITSTPSSPAPAASNSGGGGYPY